MVYCKPCNSQFLPGTVNHYFLPRENWCASSKISLLLQQLSGRTPAVSWGMLAGLHQGALELLPEDKCTFSGHTQVLLVGPAQDTQPPGKCPARSSERLVGVIRKPIHSRGSHSTGALPLRPNVRRRARRHEWPESICDTH